MRLGSSKKTKDFVTTNLTTMEYQTKEKEQVLPKKIGVR